MAFNFANQLIAWYAEHGRTGMPWQNTRDPYAIWVSEIMLQQTQVSTVTERYQLFLKRFPTLKSLAKAPIDDVMALWSGLGYYSRARNLHRCAQIIMAEHGGDFPQTREALESLPGIGRSTAGAIAAFAYEERSPILDANVKRVLSRFYGIEGDLQDQKTIKELWLKAEAQLPRVAAKMPTYTQALMDFGATWCTPKHAKCLEVQAQCPMTRHCTAYQTNRTVPNFGLHHVCFPKLSDFYLFNSVRRIYFARTKSAKSDLGRFVLLNRTTMGAAKQRYHLNDCAQCSNIIE